MITLRHTPSPTRAADTFSVRRLTPDIWEVDAYVRLGALVFHRTLYVQDGHRPRGRDPESHPVLLMRRVDGDTHLVEAFRLHRDIAKMPITLLGWCPEDEVRDTVRLPITGFDDEEESTKPSINSLKVPCAVCNSAGRVVAHGIAADGSPTVNTVKCGACKGSGTRPATRVDVP